MEYEIEVYSCLCELSKFNINGIDADYEDFGNKYDSDSDGAEPYGCGNMIFEGKSATQTILDKYKISLEDYNKIIGILEEKLSFGCCGWCV